MGAMMFPALLVAAALALLGPVPIDQTFKAPAGGEAVAVIHASCGGCDWGVEGREAAAIRILIDGKYSQHLLIARGAQDADYHVTLGPMTPGEHTLRIEADSKLSSPQAGSADISKVDIVVITPAGDD